MPSCQDSTLCKHCTGPRKPNGIQTRDTLVNGLPTKIELFNQEGWSQQWRHHVLITQSSWQKFQVFSLRLFSFASFNSDQSVLRICLEQFFFSTGALSRRGTCSLYPERAQQLNHQKLTRATWTSVDKIKPDGDRPLKHSWLKTWISQPHTKLDFRVQTEHKKWHSSTPNWIFEFGRIDFRVRWNALLVTPPIRNARVAF